MIIQWHIHNLKTTWNIKTYKHISEHNEGKKISLMSKFLYCWCSTTTDYIKSFSKKISMMQTKLISKSQTNFILSNEISKLCQVQLHMLHRLTYLPPSKIACSSPLDFQKLNFWGQNTHYMIKGWKKFTSHLPILKWVKNLGTIKMSSCKTLLNILKVMGSTEQEFWNLNFTDLLGITVVLFWQDTKQIIKQRWKEKTRIQSQENLPLESTIFLRN